MPTPLEFIERVIPFPGPDGPGWVNLHWARPKDENKPRLGQPFKTAAALIDKAQWLVQNPSKCTDVWFCLTVQSDCATHAMGFPVAVRTIENARLVKALWIDVDVKDPPKGYSTLMEALDAIEAFRQAAGLPPPSAMVFSGGGIHVYWISDRPLTIDEWRPYAEGLKVEVQRFGLRNDIGVIADAARVMRMPGTFNSKLPKKRVVKVAALGADYDFATALGHLKTIGASHVTAAVTKKAPFDLSAFAGKQMASLLAPLNRETDKLSDGVRAYNDLPLDPRYVIKECPHYRDAFTHGGKGHGQGLWNLTVLGTTWFENGRDFAHACSNKYPSYTPEETNDMFDRKMDERVRKGLGWPSCAAFESEGCKLCKTCVYKGKITSPLKLAERVIPPPLEDAAVAPAGATAVSLAPAVKFPIPKGFCWYQERICAEMPDDEDGKHVNPEPLFHGYVISRPWTTGHPHTLNFKYRQGVNYSEVSIPYADMNTDAAIAKCLGQCGVQINYDKPLRRFMRSLAALTDDAFKRMTTAPFGWTVEEGLNKGFAYGGKIYNADGSEEDAGYANPTLREDYTPCGQPEPTLELMQIIYEEDRPELECIELQSWLSPLLQVVGLNSFAFWVWSNGSGGGKTTALRCGMSLWSAPSKTRNVATTTPTSIEVKMSQLRNLPCVLDEVTDKEIVEQLRKTIQLSSEGHGGDRSTRNLTLRKGMNWEASMLIGSNTSMHEFQRAKGTSSDAGAQRVFEVLVIKKDGKKKPGDVRRLVRSLDYNYGHLGMRWAKFIAMNYDRIYARGKEIEADVELKLGTNNAHRFWQGAVILTILAAEFANEMLGKEQFRVEKIRTFLFAKFKENADWVDTYIHIGGSTGQSEALMNKMLEHFMNNTVATDHMSSGPGDRRLHKVLTNAKGNSMSGFKEVYVHFVFEPAMLRIRVPPIDQYITDIKEDPTVVRHMMKTYGGKVRKVNLLAGIKLPVTTPREPVWEIPMSPEHPLYHWWANHCLPAEQQPVTQALVAQDEAKEIGKLPDLTKQLAQAAQDNKTVFKA